jgi:hypothetical protein
MSPISTATNPRLSRTHRAAGINALDVDEANMIASVLLSTFIASCAHRRRFAAD